MSVFDHLYKIIVLGESTVGKTSLICKYVHDDIPYNVQATIGVDFKVKHAIHDGKLIKLQIWDTAGQETFHSIIRYYYRNVAAAIIVFDVNEIDTFKKVSFWLDELRKNNVFDIPIILVGNKIDRDESIRKVSNQEAQTYADNNRLIYLESSVIQNFNIKKIFNIIIEQSLSYYNNTQLIYPGVRFEPNTKFNCNSILPIYNARCPAKVKKMCC